MIPFIGFVGTFTLGLTCPPEAVWLAITTDNARISVERLRVIRPSKTWAKWLWYCMTGWAELPNHKPKSD